MGICPANLTVLQGQGQDPHPEDEAAINGSRKRKRTKNPPKSEPSSSSKSRKRKQRKGDKEYGVTRGVDFVDVACVLNFDLPTTSRAYTHRVGRTARAGRTGMSLSFVVPSDQWGKNKVVGCVESAKNDEVVFAKVEKEQAARGSKIQQYNFDMKQVEAFRYRMEDALRSVTKSAIREARIKELKMEVLNSDKLKVSRHISFMMIVQRNGWVLSEQAHFEDNPLDLEYLRHDKPLHPTRVQPHMKHIPKYLLPRIAPVPGTTVGETGGEQKVGFVPFKKSSSRGRGRGGGRGGRGGSRGGKRKSDPLKKFRR